MENAAAYARQAKEHAEDSVNQISDIVNRLKEAQSYLIGTVDDAIMPASNHLKGVAEAVGSTTAENLAARYEGVADEIRSSVLSKIAEAITNLDPMAAILLSLGNDTEALAAQLGG